MSPVSTNSRFLLYGLERPRLSREWSWAIGAGLGLAGLAAVWFPLDGGLPLVSWTVALAPIYLLLYFRGWRGAAVGFLAVAAVATGGRALAGALGAAEASMAGLPVYVWTLAAASLAGAVTLEAVRAVWRGQLADPITGLPDRRLVDAFLRKQMAAARRGRSLTVALVALDGCREFDPRCGTGDRGRALERVGRVLAANSREMDFIGYYGEERFLAVMPGESSSGVSVFADRVRSEVAEVPLPERGGCTVSVGVASHEVGVDGAAELIRRAEDALAWARNLGGDRVILYGRPAYKEGPVRPHFQAEKRPLI